MTAEKGQPGILAGIRIIEFCHVGVGPITMENLADAGAEVIRVESQTRPDLTRRNKIAVSAVPYPDGSAVFAAYNHGKLGASLNLKHPKGIELVKRLVAISDIVADSFTPGVMDRLGLGYEELRKIKPDIIQISMSFAGTTGPYGSQKGHGMVLVPLLGVPECIGWPDKMPMAPATAYTDHYCPEVWDLAILGALLRRNKTGEGTFLDASDFEGGVDASDTALLEYAANGRQRPRRGNRHEWAVPHGCYPCYGEDRWCVIQVFKDKEWRSLCEAMGKPELAVAERFATFDRRRESEDELDAIIGRWTKERDAYEVMHLLQAAGVHAGVVQDAPQTLSDPQLHHRHHYWEIPDDPNDKYFTHETVGFQLGLTPLQVRKRAPKLGEDNDYVFHELLGMPDEEFAGLISEGAIE